MPLFPSIVVLLAVLTAAAAAYFYGRHRRRGLLARFRNDWGRPAPPGDLDDDRVAEAWRETGAECRGDYGVDDRTWTDLDLDRVLATIDRTGTPLGRQAFYLRLRSGRAWRDSPALEALTTAFSREAGLRETVGVQLAAGARSVGYGLWIITRPDLIRLRWWYWAFPPLAIAMAASVLALPFDPRALLVVVAVAVLNMAVRMAMAWQIPGLLAPMRQLGPLLATAERVARTFERTRTDAPKVLDTVEALRSLRLISRWVSRDASASGDLLAALGEYLNIFFILDANALLFAARSLRRLGPGIGEVAGWLGDVDLALSIASLRAEPRPWSIPRPTDQAGTRVAGIWHPLVSEPVPNDVVVGPGTGLIITGANMSGKSTYLRSVGVAAVLARAIDTCPATSWEGPFWRVRSLIGRADDLARGKSYYQVEAEGVVALLQAAREGAPTIFLLDELLRGTNTIERLAAGEAVLRALLGDGGGGSPHAVIVATHDGELGSMLRGLYAPFHFRETIGPDGLTFDHRRREGPASTRTAIALLEATGAPKGVIDAARARAEALDLIAGPRADEGPASR